MGVAAQIPQWAKEAGMPTPRPSEAFEEYVSRLGLDPARFIRENERSRHLANMRLTTYLTKHFPSYFETYMERKRGTRWYTPDD